MKTVFLSINSKYIHTLLAPRYLCANTSLPVTIMETNVNVQEEQVLAMLYNAKPDVIAISCYVFNIEFVRRLLPDIRVVLPNAKIILGGYEVTFDTQRYLPLCDVIIKGEGDFVFGQVLENIRDGAKDFPYITDAGYVERLDDIASPYTDEYCKMGGDKILYMETSRGCPFACSYCMSARSHGVRAFSLPRVFSHLATVMRYKPKQIKFVDRTFNYNVERAATIIERITESYADCGTNFHFEMAPELFNERLFTALSAAPKGLFQLEIGVQSFNEETLKAVGRAACAERVESNLRRLITADNVKIHVDLIAGLPREDYKSFTMGFNRLIALRPHQLQLGFLKLLHGAKITEEQPLLKAKVNPPYEVVATPELCYEEILMLKRAEEALELYYNSRRFLGAMDLILDAAPDTYAFFYGLGNRLCPTDGEKVKLSAYAQYSLLYEYATETIFTSRESADKLEQALITDYKQSGNTRSWHK